MKLKKILALTMAALMLLTVVSCSKKDDTASAEEMQNRINELYDEENALFAKHADQWNIVFNNMDKEAAMNNTDDYVTFIKKNIEACADLLSDDDRAILNKDIERIAEIEEEIMTLSEKLGTSDLNPGLTNTVFPSFAGKDFDGNDVDSSIFANNAVTVINFWFNGCSPCVNELGDLSELNDSLKERGGELIGVNVEAFDGNEKIIEEAKSLLAAKNATYRNIYFASDSEAAQYAAQIMAFPTTVFVDRQGNIVGEPIVGAINSDETMKEVNTRIDNIIAADEAAINAVG